MLDASQCPPTVTVEATLMPHHATDTDQHWQLGNLATWQQSNSNSNVAKNKRSQMQGGKQWQWQRNGDRSRSRCRSHGIQHGSQVETFRVILAATQPCYLFCTFRFPPTAPSTAPPTWRHVVQAIWQIWLAAETTAAAPPRDSHTQSQRRKPRRS